MPKNGHFGHLEPNISKFNQSWCSTTWVDLQTWPMAQNDPSNLLYKIRTEKIFLSHAILVLWHFNFSPWLQNSQKRPNWGLYGVKDPPRGGPKNFFSVPFDSSWLYMFIFQVSNFSDLWFAREERKCEFSLLGPMGPLWPTTCFGIKDSSVYSLRSPSGGRWGVSELVGRA